ncbi:MAG: FKBP-type peptidyl-prolyl cis-trans isomerase [Deltaproteobacteria bacterium]
MNKTLYTQKSSAFFSWIAISLLTFGVSVSAADPSKATACKKEKDVTQLVKKDLVKGKGKEAKAGATVTVHYTGCLTNGTKFDSSFDAGKPFTFNLGQGQVIKGWDTGVEGMKVGGKRKLVIPADMGYGAAGAGGVIPPNSTLVFTVELIDVVAN